MAHYHALKHNSNLQESKTFIQVKPKNLPMVEQRPIIKPKFTAPAPLQTVRIQMKAEPEIQIFGLPILYGVLKEISEKPQWGLAGTVLYEIFYMYRRSDVPHTAVFWSIN